MSKSTKEYLEALQYYVPTGTTEGERHILIDAFVQFDQYAKIITPPPGSPRILVGKKGSGKSAVVDFSLGLMEKAHIPTLKLKPLDFDLSEMPTNGAVGQLTRIAYSSLLRALSNTVGSSLDGLLTGSNAALYEEATREGTREASFLGKMASLLSDISKPLTGVDFKSILPSANGRSLRLLEKALTENVAASGKLIYLLIDDIDQVASPDEDGHLNRIWAFLLASRELTQKIPELRCIISIRDEVWRLLGTVKVSQRDQMDHFSPLVYKLNPSLDHVQEIVERRLYLAARKCDEEPTQPPYDLFFEKERPRMPTSSKTSTWADLIRSRSRERPRDAIQLVEKLAKKAIESTPITKISDGMLELIMPEFSRERATLLSQEFERECPKLLHVIRSFSKMNFDQGSFAVSTESLREFLGTIPSTISLYIEGTVINPSKDTSQGCKEDILLFWNFLFAIGFIYPRVSDVRQRKGYRFINVSEEPDFVSTSRWNDMQKAIWEIHPVYRDFLINEQKALEASTGISRKRKPSSRK